MTTPTVYHGTPLTPRAALLDVCTGRAMCVSFYRPDDVDAVEEISPAIMYDNGAFSFWQQALREGKEWAEDRDWTPFLSLAGNTLIPSGTLGSHPGHAGRAVPAQRCTAQRLAVWAEGRAALAHGWVDRSLGAVVRALRARLPRMGGRDEGRSSRGLRCFPQAHGRGCSLPRQPLAGHPHDARNGCCPRLSVPQRGQHKSGTERVAVRFPDGRSLRGPMAGTPGLCRQIRGETR